MQTLHALQPHIFPELEITTIATIIVIDFKHLKVITSIIIREVAVAIIPTATLKKRYRYQFYKVKRIL